MGRREQGRNLGDWFGRAVSGSCDVNGDGFSDVIVGAPQNDNVAYDAGSAYIYFGGDLMDNVADVILFGESGSDYFGSSVSSAYDVNKDGFDDYLSPTYLMGSHLLYL